MKLLLKSDKSKQSSNIVRIKFVMKIHCNQKEVMLYHSKNGNTNRKDADIIELKQIYKFNPFDYLGHVNSVHNPPSHNKIQVHPIYDYKQYGIYKAQMVASGNMTVTKLESYYSRVISLFSMRTAVFLAKLKIIETHTGDISNTYLTARTT